jgi:intein/homing endonuclease
LLELGMDYTISYNKHVPHCILESPIDVQKGFIRGLFEGDGSYRGKNIRLVTSSEQMAHDIQVMLQNMGIMSFISKQIIRNTQTKKYYTAFTLGIFGRFIKKYYKEIGHSISEIKTQELKEVYEYSLQHLEKTNFDVIPNGGLLLRELYKVIKEHLGTYKKGTGITFAFKSYKNLYAAMRNSSCSRYVLTKLYKEATAFFDRIHIEKPIKAIEQILFEDILYVAIKNIEDSEADVYDLSVPINENFLGNGIINHNSQGSEADAVVCVIPDTYIVRHMLTRNLLYTGVTRAKKVCILAAKDKEIIKAIKTSGTETRYTDLTDKLEFWYRKLGKTK